MPDVTVVKISELASQGTVADDRKFLVELPDGTFAWLNLTQIAIFVQEQTHYTAAIEGASDEIDNIITDFSLPTTFFAQFNIATTSRAIALNMTHVGVTVNFLFYNNTANTITVVLDSTCTFTIAAGVCKEVSVLVYCSDINAGTKKRVYTVGGTAVTKTI